MKKAIFAAVGTVVALSSISLAQAQSTDNSGFYAGAAVTANKYQFNSPNAASADNNNGYKAGGKIYGGYDIDKNFAVEAGYSDMGKKDYNYSVNGADGRIKTDSHSFYVAGKATAPINEQVSVFGKLGVASTHDSLSGTGIAAPLNGSDGSKTGLYASLGAQYAINQKVSLVAEYEYTDKNQDFGRKKGSLGFGARYNF